MGEKRQHKNGLNFGGGAHGHFGHYRCCSVPYAVLAAPHSQSEPAIHLVQPYPLAVPLASDQGEENHLLENSCCPVLTLPHWRSFPVVC